MKKLTQLFTFCLLFSLLACAGNEKDKEKKASPYAKAETKIEKTEISINYSSPRKKDRKLWGELVPYGLVWRTGADEATVFETSEDILIEGEPLKKGKYSFFTIPNKDEWTVIFNNEANQWGAFNYDESKDELRVKVKPVEVDNSVENMSFFLLETEKMAGEIRLAWGKLIVPVSFTILPVVK